jgi:single-stranded-DNA-specific exonuclease
LGLPGHPAVSLPGVGVAYQLAAALYEILGAPGGETQYLDLVALGIVADLALLGGDTRHLLQLGLAKLRKTQRPGLQVILELAEIDPSGMTEEHIGFEIGPRLNALGRLSDANPAVELLTTMDPARARVIATQLEGLNAQRKLLTTQVYQGALAQIERDLSLLRSDALVLAHSAWPAGVIGIVASRLVEDYGKPVALIAAPDGELARGSARSILGVDIAAAIAACSDHLASYGGHPMAAGFALRADQISRFRSLLSAAVGEQLSGSEIEPALLIDGYLSLGELSPELVSDLERLAPFGPGNPRLVLVAEGLHLLNHSTLGRTGEHLKMVVTSSEEGPYKIVWWGGGTGELPDWLVEGVPFDLAYTARSSDFRGRREVQLEWVDAIPVEEINLDFRETRPEIHVEDFRREGQPLAILKGILAEGGVLVWAEGEARGKLSDQGVSAADRLGLTPAKRLAIWSSPPGLEELQAALEAVSPEIVYLFAADPGADRLEPFILRLAGLAKYALNMTGGHTSPSALAAATAQSEATVRLGLDWLAAHGHLKLSDSGEEDVVFAQGGEENLEEVSRLSKQLVAALAESAAFRAHYSRADARALIDFHSST